MRADARRCRAMLIRAAPRVAVLRAAIFAPRRRRVAAAAHVPRVMAMMTRRAYIRAHYHTPLLLLDDDAALSYDYIRSALPLPYAHTLSFSSPSPSSSSVEACRCCCCCFDYARYADDIADVYRAQRYSYAKILFTFVATTALRFDTYFSAICCYAVSLFRFSLSPAAVSLPVTPA